MQNKDKNRVQKMIPADRDRPRLMTLKRASDDYINAVFVNGIRKAENYIITQSPLPSTVDNFWSLVFDYNCSIIVTLDNISGRDEVEKLGLTSTFKLLKNVPIFWPPTVTTAHGLLTLSCVSHTPAGSEFFSQMYTLTCDTFEIKQHTVQHIYACVDPSDTEEHKHNVLSRAVAELEAVRVGDDQKILIHCRDGVRLSTVMCALLIGIEQKKVNQVVDLSTAVQLVRLTRPQAIQCLDDYKLLHHLMETFKTQDQTYVNYQKQDETHANISRKIKPMQN